MEVQTMKVKLEIAGFPPFYDALGKKEIQVDLSGIKWLI
jgi:hypothetical protein